MARRAVAATVASPAVAIGHLHGARRGGRAKLNMTKSIPRHRILYILYHVYLYIIYIIICHRSILNQSLFTSSECPCEEAASEAEPCHQARLRWFGEALWVHHGLRLSNQGCLDPFGEPLEPLEASWPPRGQGSFYVSFHFISFIFSHLHSFSI